MPEYDVFLSYHHTDRSFVERVATTLLSRNLTVWWDFVAEAGEEWRKPIDRALQRSRTVVCLWSPASLASETCLREARRARRANKILPIALKGFSWSQVPDDLWDICIRLAVLSGRDTRSLEWLVSELRFRRGFYFADRKYEMDTPPTSEPPVSVPQIRKNMLEAFTGRRDAKAPPVKVETLQKMLKRARPDVVKRADAYRAREKARQARLEAIVEQQHEEAIQPGLVVDLDLVRRSQGKQIYAGPMRNFGHVSAVKAHELVPVPPRPKPIAEVLAQEIAETAQRVLLHRGELAFLRVEISYRANVASVSLGEEGDAPRPRPQAPFMGSCALECAIDQQESQELRLQRVRLCESPHVFGVQPDEEVDAIDLSWDRVAKPEVVCWPSAQPPGDAAWHSATAVLTEAEQLPPDLRRLLEGEAVEAPVLTRRQLECLRFARDGRSNQEIAEICGVSRRTVRSHLRRIKALLGVGARSDAIAAAIERGLI